jgi:hypothetical protein
MRREVLMHRRRHLPLKQSMLMPFDDGAPAPLWHSLKGQVVVEARLIWPTLRRYLERVVAAVGAATPGSFTEVEIPFG